MVASISAGMPTGADPGFSKLDTKNRGHIDKTDLQSALSVYETKQASESGNGVSIENTTRRAAAATAASGLAFALAVGTTS